MLIKGHPAWSGRAKHSYGHLLFLDIASGVHDVRMLQIANLEVIPHGVRCEGLLRVLSWVSFDLPTHLKGMVGTLLQAVGGGNTELHTVAIQGRDFFFPSCTSVALARSSHIVVLIERITHMHTLYPSLGVRKWGTDHYSLKSWQSKKTHKQNTNKNQHNKHKQTKQKPTKPSKEKTDKTAPKDHSSWCAGELNDLAHER